jgi:hypothetical protein
VRGVSTGTLPSTTKAQLELAQLGKAPQGLAQAYVGFCQMCVNLQFGQASGLAEGKKAISLQGSEMAKLQGLEQPEGEGPAVPKVAQRLIAKS